MTSPKTVLITGGAGFIGSHTAAALLSRGDNVVIVDEVNDYYDPRLKVENLNILCQRFGSDRCKIYIGDVCDLELLLRIVENDKIDYVCHLAARAGVRHSLDDPFVYVHSNVRGTLSVLEMARRSNGQIKNFVYASSSSVYGDTARIPFDEKDSTSQPVSQYAATKKSCELLAYNYHHLYRIPVTGLRFFSVYGPRGRPDMAAFKFIDSIYRGLPIDQYGDGRTARDYTFISDIVAGVVASIDTIPMSGFELYNLGCGRPVELSSFIAIIESLLRKKAEIQIKPMQPGDVTITFASIDKASRDLGYRPRVSCADGLRATVEWYLTEYVHMRPTEPLSTRELVQRFASSTSTSASDSISASSASSSPSLSPALSPRDHKLPQYYNSSDPIGSGDTIGAGELHLLDSKQSIIDTPIEGLLTCTRVHAIAPQPAPSSSQSDGFPQTLSRLVDWTMRALSWSRSVAVAIDCTDGRSDLFDSIHSALRTAFDSTELARIRLIRVAPWGRYVAPLNALLNHAVQQQATTILFQSIEVAIGRSEVARLVDHISEDTLCAGAALDGHNFEEGTQLLDGTSTPWNTCAVWSVPKLARFGFVNISEGVPSATACDGSVTAGVEEVATIALHQRLYQSQSTIKLVKFGLANSHERVTWNTNWNDSIRSLNHRSKMTTKRARAAAQLQSLQLDSASLRVVHLVDDSNSDCNSDSNPIAPESKLKQPHPGKQPDDIGAAATVSVLVSAAEPRCESRASVASTDSNESALSVSYQPVRKKSRIDDESEEPSEPAAAAARGPTSSAAARRVSVDYHQRIADREKKAADAKQRRQQLIPDEKAREREWLANRMYGELWTAEYARRGVASAADYIDLLIGQFTQNVAIEYVSSDIKMTYGQLDAHSNQIANWAIAKGFKERQAVSLLMDNCPLFVSTWLGLAKIGCTIALINTSLVDNALAHAVRTAASSRIVVAAGMASNYLSAAHLLADVEVYWAFGEISIDSKSRSDRLPFAPPRAQSSRVDFKQSNFDAEVASFSCQPRQGGYGELRRQVTLDDPLFYIYTSGTTGPSKAAFFSNRRFIGAGLTWCYPMQLTAADKYYITLPMYHGNGGVVAVSAIMKAGGTMVIRKKFSATNFWTDVRAYGCTATIYIGELWRYLHNQPKKDDDADNPLRVIAGNGLRTDIWDEVLDRFGIERVVEHYGMTEMPAGPYMNCYGRPGACGFIPPAISRQLGADKLVRFDVERDCVVRDSKTNFCTEVSEAGAAGECIFLLARTDDEYRNRPYKGYTSADASLRRVYRNVFAAGDAWFATGDLLSKDSDGFYYFVDRIGDSFRWKGQNVSTNEVAEVVAAFPGVLEANVYGVTYPGREGRAGMVSARVDFGPPSDLKAAARFMAGLYRYLDGNLPTYAVPLFLRLRDQQNATTGTLKYQKFQYQKDGWDPNVVSDRLYFCDMAAKTYVPLTPELYAVISDKLYRI